MRLFLIRAVTGLAALLSASAAFAQCGTSLPGGTICGNPTPSQGLNQPITNPVLGIPGSKVGSIGFANLTSGTVTLQPVTGALGTRTILIPAASGTMAVNATGPITLSAAGTIACPTCTTGGSGSFAGTSPITVSFPAGVVTYAFDFTVANTFLAQQTNQGATTTSPGWYAQIAGDTVPRVRIGMNATDIPSVAFGPGNANRDAFIERLGAGSLRLGAPDAAAPVAQTLSVQNVVAGTSNTVGPNLTIAGSRGTGTGTGGSIIFQTATAGATGTSQNALATIATIGTTTALSLTPAALSNNQGLNVTNSTPNGGSVAGPIHLNSITATFGTQDVTGTFDSFNQIANRVDALQVNTTVTGGTATNHFGINSMMNVTGANDGAIALNGGLAISSGASIAFPAWGIIGFTQVTAGTTHNHNNNSAIEAEIGGASTASALTRVGISSVAFGTMPAGTHFDAAFMTSLVASAGTPYSGATPFTNGMHFSSSYYGASTFPIAATGSMFLADTGTVATIFNFPTITSTTVLSTPNVNIAGSGASTFGSGSPRFANAVTSNLANGVVGSCTSCGYTQIYGQANSSAGVNGVQIADSSSNNTFGIFAYEASFSAGTRFGVTPNNYAQAIAQGSTNAGALFGTVTSVPVIIGTNNTARITIAGTGLTTISGGLTVTGSFTATGLVTNADLVNAATTVNGQTCTLGSTCTVTATASSTLTIGTHLTGTSYNGSAPVTIATDAVSTNTASTIVARDGSGNFSAGTITASLTGHSSLDCALTGCTMSGAIAMGTNAITGLTTLASAGAMTFQSNGSTLAMTITTGQKIGMGTETNPQAALVVSSNVTTGIPVHGGTVIALNGADASSATLTIQSFGTGQNPAIVMRGANGTAASPSASQSGDFLGLYSAKGYAATNYDAALQSGMAILAGENHTLTANGTYVAFFTVANGTTSRAEAGRFFGSGGLAIGTTTDPGAGSIQVNTTIIAPNLTSDAGLTDTTVCWKNSATTGTFLKGSGTLGICLGTSGRQFKTAFEPMVAGMDEIAKVKLWNYFYKRGFGDGGERMQYGPTAQDVEAVLPDLVRHDDKGNAINYDIGAFVPISLHALQQLNERLTSAVQDLRAANDNLRQEVAKLKAVR